MSGVLHAHDLSSGLILLFALVIGHAIADYPLQGEFLSVVKNRHASIDRFFPPGKVPKGMWIHALTAHSIIHAAPVWILTGSVSLAAAEIVLHWLIDYAKCEDWTGFTTDQCLHVLCKVLYVVALFFCVV